MAITIRQRLAPSWYTPESEQGESIPARFRVRPLDGVERLEVYDHLEFDSKSGRSYLTAKGVALCASAGVIGWEGIPGEDGKPAAFTRPALRDLDPMLIRELGLHVFHLTELGEDAEKNS